MNEKTSNNEIDSQITDAEKKFVDSFISECQFSFIKLNGDEDRDKDEDNNNDDLVAVFISHGKLQLEYILTTEHVGNQNQIRFRTPYISNYDTAWILKLGQLEFSHKDLRGVLRYANDKLNKRLHAEIDNHLNKMYETLNSKTKTKETTRKGGEEHEI